VKSGKKAAYGALKDESKDILTLKIGNIPPTTAVKIKITYLQELTLVNNTFYQLLMTGSLSPRYMTHIPQDKIIRGLKNQAVQEKGTINWDFRISLKTTRSVNFCNSHTHKLELLSQNDSKTVSTYTMVQTCVPNTKFILNYTTEDYHLPSYVLSRSDAGSSAMLSFIPKFCELSLDDAYKASVEGR
jgi:hypothetical protein